MSESKPLSDRHRLFAFEYCRCLNKTRAYQAVYPDASPAAAEVGGHRLLRNPKVLAFVREIQQGKLTDLDMDAEAVLVELTAIARSDITDVLEEDENGRLRVRNLN